MLGPGVRQLRHEPSELLPLGYGECPERSRSIGALLPAKPVHRALSGRREAHPSASCIIRVGVAHGKLTLNGLLHEAGGSGLVHADAFSEFADAQRGCGVRELAEHAQERGAAEAAARATATFLLCAECVMLAGETVPAHATPAAVPPAVVGLVNATTWALVRAVVPAPSWAAPAPDAPER